MRLYHYSNIDIKGYIKPSYFGYNSYTNNSVKISQVIRSYFYTRPEPEALLRGSKYIYNSVIDKNKLYNLKTNKIKNFVDIYYTVKKLGYKGIILDDTVVLFYQSRIIKKEAL
jgi:hypothetical protein